jgi:hypothetical protein
MPKATQRIRVSDNNRFLVSDDGSPFFWLGDTAWELFHRLNREDAARYFADRAAKRFTVIQAVVLAEMQGLTTPNAYGDVPFEGGDPARPVGAYFRLVDEYIGMAADHGLYVGLLPTWGDKVFPAWAKDIRPVFDATSARAYGRWLGARCAEAQNVIWVLGGDRPAIHDGVDDRPIWRAMAEGIDEATGGEALMTYHPSGGCSTSEWLHDEPWLDVNMMQSGHGSGRDAPVWERIAADYARAPAKPVLDGEPNYEDHPVNPWPAWNPANGFFRDDDVRRQVYRSVFAGGCGVTYGHHDIWQMYAPGRALVNQPPGYEEHTWEDALDRPGATQLRHLRALMESRPYLTRIPDQWLLACDPGQGGQHIRATRDAGGSYAFVYLPSLRPVTIHLGALSGQTVVAWWYDPCSGQAVRIGAFPRAAAHTFTPPGHRPDWVLVLDDAARNFPPPGAAS